MENIEKPEPFGVTIYKIPNIVPIISQGTNYLGNLKAPPATPFTSATSFDSTQFAPTIYPVKIPSVHSNLHTSYYTPSPQLLNKPSYSSQSYSTPTSYFDWSVSPNPETLHQSPTITISGTTITIVKDPHKAGLTVYIGSRDQGRDRPKFRRPLSALKRELRNNLQTAKRIFAQTLREELSMFSSYGLRSF